jgi:cyanobactin maturation PatA/PatG family protease
MTEATLIAPAEAAAIAPESELKAAVHVAGTAMNAVRPAALPESTAPAASEQVFRRSAATAVTPSDCGCGGGATCTCGTGQAKQLIYALGKLGYDFGTEARRDRFMQFIGGNPFDPAAMVKYLAQNPYEAESLIWTLNLDATPIYAIVPAGPYAYAAYDRLREDYDGQLKSGVELVSIPGVLAGSVTLFSGQVVPTVVPAIRGMNSWSTKKLVAHVFGDRPTTKKDQEAYDHQAGGLSNFLNRIYYDLRNLGMTAPDRALNYSATNAFQATQVIISATQGQMELDSINVRKSPVCRPDSDCYDVEVAFFSPDNENRSNQVFRFTVDVSDVIPVTIGEIRSWAKRA